MTHTQTTYTNRIALRVGKKGARPAEVGALASVFKKSATELKHYDWALLNNKDIRDKYVLELRNRFETLREKTEKYTKRRSITYKLIYSQ